MEVAAKKVLATNLHFRPYLTLGKITILKVLYPTSLRIQRADSRGVTVKQLIGRVVGRRAESDGIITGAVDTSCDGAYKWEMNVVESGLRML